MSKIDVTRHASPLRYPGGKGKVANFLKLLIMQNQMEGVGYVEPYAGGASVAITLLLDGYISKAHINDLNPGVYYFWRQVIDDPDRLCARIMSVQLTIDEWKRQREVYANPDSSPEDVGFATFFLNRTNRSGIISRGGIIGGYGQQGEWGIDARFNKVDLCGRIERIAAIGSKIKVTKKDAAELVRASKKWVGERLLYLDPPYYVKGAGLYDNFYKHVDHVKIARLVRALKGPWVVSYDAAPKIMEMYSGARAIKYSLGYSAAKASQGTEVMFFSDSLELPQIPSPAGIRAADVAKFKQQAGMLNS